jgi:maltokinase
MVALLAAASETAHLRPVSTGAAPRTQWLEEGPIVTGYRVLNVEQSNTSAVYADEVLVKVFRMLTPGVNPDIEVHAGLFDAGSADVGRLRGWINGGWTDPHTNSTVYGHLAMIQEFFAGSIDGWDLARAEVAAERDFTAEAFALGEATARVHRDLATAFGTQILGPAQIADMVTRLHDRLSVAVELVPELGAMARQLHERLDRVSTLSEITVQRVHGDFHLGQALRTPRGWRILDFEGEPGGDLDSRRVLDHPMRDVAAMQRSFAYAAWQGAGNSEAAQAWQRECEAAFLDGYAAVAGVDPSAHTTLLQAYTVDKAAYEAVYEQRNRPDWIEIPLTALRELLAG